ncbi:DNA-processing protein DprA [Allosalinactinospora lopnorensis]|uniref:DNA-processing protein DprA n=1 Tax=Allosalinactinospora lopnorensis TaxID=1352348 RepID=UPI000623C099|nr:DNA-processing protein DprA [Allosalinactinospora lopnorensis]
MTGPLVPAEEPSRDAVARACLTATVTPADPLLGAMLAERGAAAVWEALRSGDDLPVGSAHGRDTARLGRWRARAAAIDADALLTRAADLGIRLVTPGDPEWPGQLDQLHEQRPYALWVRGAHDLRNACLRSVAMVGARAATGYGLHVAGELASGLAGRSWAIVSGGAYGIDAASHRGALAGGTPTVAVLACGLDRDYPRGHENLFADIAVRGTLVSEHPIGVRPTRHGFLVRNRLIAALTPGTVVVEAGLRSGALNTAGHALELHRALMAVPGPVTSALSAGCHRLLRDWQAVCVTDAADVAEQVGHIGADLRPGVACDRLDVEARRVLAAVPERSGAGAAAIAGAANLGLDSALRCLGLLAAGGFVERSPAGWRVRGR